MLAKISASYLLGILYANHFGFNKYFLLVSFIVYVLYVIIKSSINKLNIKDTIKSASYYILYISFFAFGFFYSINELQKSKQINLNGTDVKMEGKIVSLKEDINKNTYVMSVNSVIVDGMDIDSLNLKYAKILVSSNTHANLFDHLKVEYKNSDRENHYLNDENSFFEINKYEEVFFDTNLTVSFPKSFTSEKGDLNFYETIVLCSTNIKNKLTQNIEDSISEPYASIANGITYGETKNLIKDIKDIFKNTGLIHLLVLSGTNVSFIFLIVFLMFKKQREGSRVIFTILISGFFVFITGLYPPSLRALLMSASTLVGEYFGRKISNLDGLMFSLFIITLINPETLIYNTSLHLSFLATFAVFVLSPKLKRIISEKTKIKNIFLIQLLSISGSILICLNPYLLSLNSNLNILGNIFTIILEPIIFVSMILTFCMSFIFYIPVVNNFLSFLLTLLLKLILSIVYFCYMLTPKIEIHIPVIYLKIYYLIFVIVLFYYIYRNRE